MFKESKEKVRNMKKRYILDGLDCANCAEKIRSEAEKHKLITTATMNFVKQELIVEADDKASSADILKTVCEIVKKHEPDVNVFEKGNKPQNKTGYKGEIIKIISSALLFITAFTLEHTITENTIISTAVIILYILSYLICGIAVAITAFKGIMNKSFFNENTLMLIASIGAIILGEYEEAAAVMLFYTVGELFQSIAVNRSRKSISSLIETKPETAELLTDSGYITVAPEEVLIGSIIRVKPGEKVPLDGIIESGSTSVDTSALTGESLPRDVGEGDEISAGSINISGLITIRTTRRFEDSTVCKMLELVESAVEKKTKTENFISVFAKYYTPIVVLAAVVISLIPPLFTGFDFATWVQRGLIFLVISCPCALVISVPLGYFAGIGKASSKGILVKGSNYLEAIAKTKVVLFDKTGTLTKGRFEVTSIDPVGMSKEELLKYAAYAESSSNHPIAVSVRNAYGEAIDESQISGCSEIAGKGIKAVISGVSVLCGNSKLMAENNIDCPDVNGTVLYIALDGKFAGSIEIADTPKEHSAKAVKMLKDSGVKVVMLTGDNNNAAQKTAKELGINDVFSGLLPEDKSEITLREKSNLSNNGKVMFVGDGINDAPVITSADIGVAMGGAGADSAIETADCVLMYDDPMQLADAFTISKKTNRIVKQNIVFALGVKLIVQVLGVLGIANMWAAVFADVGVSIIAIFNSLRLMRK